MSTARSLAYHGLAAVAILAHVVVVGLISLLFLSMTAPAGAEIPLFILRVVVAVSWLGFLVVGLFAWIDRSWLAVVVPIGSLAVLWVVDLIGKGWIHWYLNWGD